MVEIRRLQPQVQIRPMTPLKDSPQRKRTIIKEKRRRSGRMYVRRTRREFPAPTPLDTPCVLWQGSVTPAGYGRRNYTSHPQGRVRHRNVMVHRWVIWMVDGYWPYPGQAVMHLCDNRLCYRYDHLRVGSIRENNADMVAKKRNKPPPHTVHYGEANVNAKLTWVKVRRIRFLRGQGWTYQAIGDAMGVTKVTAWRACQGETWKDEDEHRRQFKTRRRNRRDATQPRSRPGPGRGSPD